jgi:hypothetical protein
VSALARGAPHRRTTSGPRRELRSRDDQFSLERSASRAGGTPSPHGPRPSFRTRFIHSLSTLLGAGKRPRNAELETISDSRLRRKRRATTAGKLMRLRARSAASDAVDKTSCDESWPLSRTTCGQLVRKPTGRWSACEEQQQRPNRSSLGRRSAKREATRLG